MGSTILFENFSLEKELQNQISLLWRSEKNLSSFECSTAICAEVTIIKLERLWESLIESLIDHASSCHPREYQILDIENI